MGNNCIIINGPYLLAPTAGSMTVSWEADHPVTAVVRYGENEELNNSLTVKCQRGAPWRDNPAGICMYRAVLEGLRPSTAYRYQVECGGNLLEGSFTTLSAEPEEIRIMTLGDSHLFKISELFTETVLAERPDFILHSGDISLATGHQKDEYTVNWFKPGAGFLAKVPVVYTPGNHDISPYYDDFFLAAQRQRYDNDETGQNTAFTYGNTRFLIVNSNPWGLFEMNAANSNLPVTETTRQQLETTLQWLKEDLESAAAQSAAWRVLVLHHPYTDDFTHKQIVSIAEKYNVNFVLGGHVHYYVKNISVNPSIGAKTVYISQGCAEDYAAELDCGQPGQRMLPDFPEVIATGDMNYGCLIISKDKLVFSGYGFVAGENQPRLVDEVIMTPEKPRLSFSNGVIIPGADGTARIEADVTNQGNGLAGVVLPIEDNGETVLHNLFGDAGKERVVALNAGESQRIQAVYKVSGAGLHQLTAAGAQATVNVEALAPLVVDNMTVKIGAAANVVIAEAEAANNRPEVCQAEVSLYVDGREVARQPVNLQPYEQGKVEFHYAFSRGGSYQVAIGGLTPQEVAIEGTLQVIPTVRDLSGNGNHALLRGTPAVITEADKTVLCLNSDEDYLEIPDADSLHIESGYTGMVWANVQRLVGHDEMGHNPLMVKGLSVGWGVNYLLRMVIERNGKLKWGTCYDITEYSWQGGYATVGEWVQYTSSFDKQTGGTSYCNRDKVAETSGISGAAVLRNWEGQPLFVGYSYIGHIIKEIGRPKYYTHLPAQLSQVRFYRRKLSATEQEYVNEHPQSLGPASAELAVWLDFREIDDAGRHVTEWRRPAVFHATYKAEQQLWAFTQLAAEAEVPAGSSLLATVEVSDNGETVKDAKHFVLKSGTEVLDLSGLSAGQYVRIVTAFKAQIGAEGTCIPKLHSYGVTAVCRQRTIHVTWATRTDWERGQTEGAVGFAPLHRTKVFDQYTDVIHG